MKYRSLGRSEIRVSEIGFGAWGIGGATPGATSYGETDDEVSRRALEEAFDLGITFFDTANVYGNGHSEALIGEAFSGRRRADVVISTKVGCHDFHQPLDFSPQAITPSLDGSLQRLGTDYIDLLMLHDPLPTQDGLDETFETLDKFKAQGKVRSIGVSLRAPEDIKPFLERFEIDAFQVNFNLMDQRLIASGTLEMAKRAGSGIIARTPLCFGFLSGSLDGDVTFASSDHRARWPSAQIQAWQEGARLFSECLVKPGEQRLSQAALRYCLSYAGVASVIPGILTPEESHENASASALGAFSEQELREIERLYQENSFFAKRPVNKLAMADK